MRDIFKILQMAFGNEQALCVDNGRFQAILQSRMSGQSRPVAMPLTSERRGSVEVINVAGVMVRKAEWSDDVSTEELSAAFDAAAKDDTIGAVVLNIDSPGGFVNGQEDLTNAANRLAAAKPLYAFASDYCCSAAYWLATTAKTIYARNDATVGSIGTRMMVYDFSQFFKNVGVEAVNIDTGEFKSMGAMGTPITENHREHLQQVVKEAHADFEAAVTSGRGFTAEQLAAVNDAKVYSPKPALKLQLIDGIRSLAEVITEAAAVATPPTTVSARSKIMSEGTSAASAATLPQLKASLPGASSDFLIAQMEKGATVEQAMSAHMLDLSASVEAEKTRADEAETARAAAEEKASKAATATANAPEPKRKGNTSTSGATLSEDETEVDYRQMAEDRMAKVNCRWSEACLWVKKRHPESQGFFGVPPKR